MSGVDNFNVLYAISNKWGSKVIVRSQCFSQDTVKRQTGMFENFQARYCFVVLQIHMAGNATKEEDAKLVVTDGLSSFGDYAIYLYSWDVSFWSIYAI